MRNFNSGILTGWMDARADVDRWRSGLREAKNFLLTPYGPIRRRMGQQYCETTKFSGEKKSRLIPFQASSAEGYMLEFGDLYMRVIYRGEYVMAGSDPYEIVTPYTEAMLWDIQWDTVNDIAFMVQEDTPVHVLKHFAADDWVLEPMEFDWPPLMDENLTSTTLAITSVTNVPIVQTANFIDTDYAEYNVTSDVLPASGAWEVTVNSLLVNPSPPPSPGPDPDNPIPPPSLVLEGSNDGGSVWSVLQTFTVVGTFTGTYTGLIRMKSDFYTTNSTIETVIDSPQISKGDIITVQASTSFFTPDSVGRFYSMGHERDNSEVRMSLNAGSITSAPISVLGKWTLTTSLTWKGILYVDRSKDDGATWEQILDRAASYDRNIVYQGEEAERVLLRMRFTDQSGRGGDSNSRGTIEVAEIIVEGIFRVTAYTSATQVTAEVIVPFISQDATTIWRKGAWSDESGYPRTMQWHANRLVFGGTREQVGTLWLSAIEDYYDFKYGTDDADAFSVTLGGTQQEIIQWMASRDALAIGTTGGEWAGVTTDQENLVTPGSFAVKLQTGYGGAEIPAIVANNVVLYVQKTGRKIREFVFSIEINGFDGDDLTQIAIDVTRGGIIDMAMQRQRDQTLWATTGEGKLISLIYERGQRVVGWTRHETQGEYESVASVYEEGDEDSIYVIVKREVAGNPVRYVERFKTDQFQLLEDGNLEDMPFMDSYVEYNGAVESPGFTTISDFQTALAGVTPSSSLDDINGFEVIKAAADQLTWDSDPGTTKAIIFYVDTQSIGVVPDTSAVAASLLSKGIVFSQGPDFGAYGVNNYTYFVGVTGGALMTEAQMNTNAAILAKFQAIFNTPNDKLQLCIIIDKLASPADPINFQAIVATLKTAMPSIDAYLNTQFDEVEYNLMSVNSVGYTFETTTSSTGESIIGGLEHLSGETVQIMADGVVIPDQEVTFDGYITLPEPATRVFAGLGYQSDIETLPMVLQLPNGDSTGKLKKIHQADLQVFRSMDAEVAPVKEFTGQWETLVFSNRNTVSELPSVPMGQIGGIEDWKFMMPGGFSKDARIAIRKRTPGPLNILAITATYNVEP